MNNSISEHTDLIVLGGGISGYSAAIRGAQLGHSVILVEKENIGGTCLNWGCIPTKFLWEALDLDRRIKRSFEFGFETQKTNLDFNLVQQRKKKTIELLSVGLKKLIQSYSINLLEGYGKFLNEKQIELLCNNKEKHQISADKIIISTGSIPGNLKDIPADHKKILDSNDILDLQEIPKSILIIGAGVIGIEFAFILSGFGSTVTLVEKENQILPGEDKELADELKKILERQGIKISVGVQSLEQFLKQAEKIFIAVGRKPNIDNLDLDKAKIKYDKNGINVNEYLQTSNKNIFACGDVICKNYLAYISQAQGVAACENAFNKKTVLDLNTIPSVIFSQPPAASVGAKLKDLSPGKYDVGTFPYSANGKAFIKGERTGWIKIFSEKSSGKILGGQIIGYDAENLISIISLAVKYQLKVHDLSRELFFHPSLAEIIHGACEDSLNKCVDLPRKV